MKVSRTFSLFIAMVFSFAALHAYAGTRDGGGGVGVRCAGARLQMLDLHEALRAGLAPATTPLTREKAIAVTSNLLTDQIWMRDFFDRDQMLHGIEAIVTPMLDGQTFMDYATGGNDQIQFVSDLPLSQDLGLTNVAPGCTLEQVAYFLDESSTLQIVKSRWDELDWLNRSALISHELIYLFDRRQALENFGLQRPGLTSVGARDFVGKLFSINGVRAKFDLLPVGAKYLDCASDTEPQSSFIVVDSGDRGADHDANHEVTILVRGLYGMSSIFETMTKLRGTSVESLWRYDGPNAFDSETPLTFVDEARAPAFLFHFKKSAGQAAQLQVQQIVNGTPVPLGAVQRIICEMRVGLFEFVRPSRDGKSATGVQRASARAPKPRATPKSQPYSSPCPIFT